MDKLTKQLREEAEATLWLQDIFNTNVSMYSWLSEEPLNDSIDDEYNALIVEQLIPIKRRADRRKQTITKHRRLAKINSLYYDAGAEVSHEYQLKPSPKKSAHRGRMDKYPDLRKDNLAEQIAEGLAEYSYQTKVADFYKLVNQYNSTKYVLRWSELEETEDLEDFYDIYIVDESLEFNSLEDVHLHITEAFNEEWEPLQYKIIKVSCGTEELIDSWFPEAVDIPDDEEFFFGPDECFPFDDDEEIESIKNLCNSED